MTKIMAGALHSVFGTHVNDISSNFFSFFQSSGFLGFPKFINKCQKEILRCAPTSSHVCDLKKKQKGLVSGKH